MPGPDDEKRAKEALMADPKVRDALAEHDAASAKNAAFLRRQLAIGPSPDFYCPRCDVFDYEPHAHE